MEGEEDLDDYNEEADDFYVVDSWSEKSSRPDFKYNSSLSSNIHSKEDRLLRRKPTEDLKGSLCTNVPSEPSTMESSSHHLRRGRSRSPYLSSSSRYPPGREDMKFHPREGSRNHSHADNLRNDRNVLQDRRYYEEIRRHRRSRSRSRERKHHRRRSYERRSSISPSPKRESGNQSNMEQRQLPPYYPTSGASMPPNSSPFMIPNPNMGLSAHGPVQYPINSVSSNSSYGRYPGYNVPANNVFNSNLTQPQMPQNYPQNQYPGPQNYPSYNPVMPGNPPNPVSCPPSWNQSSAGFNPNYPASNVPTDAVMYPHLKIGQSRVDSYKNNHRKSMDGSPPHRQNRSLKERIRSTSRSPDPKKHKRKPSKRYSRSPVRNSSRYDSKKPKVIIDPNRIPTPPPPPIVGSYQRDESKKSFEPKMKSKDGKSDIDPLSEFLNKEKVSLSCLLEAVMETSGQGKSQLSDPKVKKEIISNCESKIQHLYKRRMTGLGAFIPDPIKPSPLTAHVSPLVMVYSPLTYNCEEENNEWHCPDIIVPEVKMKNDLKVPLDTFSPSHLPLEGAEIHSKTNFENATTIPTLSNNQSMPLSNWNANNPEHLSQTMFPNSYESSQPNMYPSHQGPQGWNNAVPSQNPYAVQPIPGSANDFNSLGPPPYGPSSYPFPHRPPGPQFMSQHSYPPQPDMLNYPSRMDYSPMHQFPPQNLNHPGMFRPSQPDLNRNNYQYVADETNKRKSKNRVNDNLILLSNNSSSHSGIAQKDKIGNFKDHKRDEIKTDGPKDKNLKKGWKSRKSSEYDHDQPITKEPKDKFYSKLNYAEMVDDAQLDSMPDYQLTNLKERIETCLAEGKPFPGYSQHRSRDKREGDRHKDRDRGRDRLRDNERPKRGSMEGERKWCNKSPLGSERKKGRSVEGDANHQHSRKSKEPSDKQDHDRENVIEVLSDEDHNKHKLSEENEVLMNPDDHLKPSEKTLLSLIFDSLGPEIRKIQEKSDLYKSVIDTLDKGDKAYKRIYSFRNQALMKSDKDNRMKMVVPRDNLKEIVILIHKSFHHVQSEELSRLLKNITYPYMLYIPKCVTKVMSECAMCIEEKKKNNEPLTDQKSERKPEKRNNRSMKDKDRDRGRDRRNSADRYKRVSKDRRSSSSSKGRRDPLRSGREKDRKDSSTSDGRPSGYEKATKVRNPGVSSISKSNKSTLDNQEEKSIPLVDDKSSELLHGLNDKALEFKPISDSVINVSVDRSIPDGVDQESLSGFDKQDYKSASTCCDVSQNDSEEKEHDPVIESSNLSKSDMESSDLVMKSETESNIVTKPETEPSIIVTNSKMEPSSTVLKPEIESSNTVTESKQESSTEVMKPKMESYDTVAKTEMESSDPSTIPEIETSKISKIPVIDSSNAATKSVMESSDTVNKTEMESTDMVSNTEMESTSTANRTEIKSTDQAADPKTNKESVNIISGSSDKLKADTVDKNQKPNERFSDKVTVANNQSTSLGEESKENKFREEKTTSQDENVNDSDSKAVPKLDFKGRVRQVQLSSNSCKNVIKALESKEEAADPSYLIKGGMLCKKDTTGNTIEVKIVVPCDELEKIVSIVHTMSAVHTPPAKVVAFFSKHFTQVENLDLQVNEIVGNCSYCKLKFS